INLHDITNGSSAAWGLFSPSYQSLLMISAYKSPDGATLELFTWDQNGINELHDFTFDTWMTFTIVFNGDGTYNLLLNGTCLLLCQPLVASAGTTIGYLAFLSGDGPTNWQGYVDDIMTTW
nr:hypothetical protein [Candidatus Sigynarchaeota archaeon]